MVLPQQQSHATCRRMAQVHRKLANYPLRERIHTENAKIVSFHLETRYKDAVGGDEEEENILDVAEKNATLRKVLPMIRHNDRNYTHGNLAGERFSGEDLGKIGKALSHNHTLIVLSLSSIALNDAGVSLICEALQAGNNNTLKELKLDSNMISDAGVECIAHSLLRDNYCENNRNELADASSHKNNIALLSAQYNCITDIGAASFASALTVNSVLTTLLIGGNPIGTAGIASFANGRSIV